MGGAESPPGQPPGLSLIPFFFLCFLYHFSLFFSFIACSLRFLSLSPSRGGNGHSPPPPPPDPHQHTSWVGNIVTDLDFFSQHLYSSSSFFYCLSPFPFPSFPSPSLSLFLSLSFLGARGGGGGVGGGSLDPRLLQVQTFTLYNNNTLTQPTCYACVFMWSSVGMWSFLIVHVYIFPLFISEAFTRPTYLCILWGLDWNVKYSLQNKSPYQTFGSL